MSRCPGVARLYSKREFRYAFNSLNSFLILAPGTAVKIIAGLAITGLFAMLPANALISPTVSVGATSGTFTVSPSGAATYTVPIVAPPGTNGMQPNLALAYNSQGGNGVVGMGWMISGLSVISRCGATIENDQFKAGVNYDSNDRFCLDGERLIQVGPNEFRTERESWQKVTFVGSLANPTYFLVTDKTGTIREYGGMSQARVIAAQHPSGLVRLWALNRIQDRHGNHLTISYGQDSGQYYPSEVQYTGNSNQGVQPYNSVKFVYQARPDVTPAYYDSAFSQFTQRLSNVRTYVGTSLVRDYRLAYTTGSATGRSILQTITECEGGGACLPATQVAWQDGGTTISFDYNGSGGTHAYWDTVIDHPTYKGRAFSGDFNGDGKADLMMIYRDPQSSAVSIYHWNTDASGHLAYAGTGNGGTHAYWDTVIDHETYHGKAFTGDFNGDGKTDLMMIYHDPQSSAVSIYHWHADESGKLSYAGTGNGGTHAYWSSVIDSETYHGKAFTGDFNGDGKTDLMMIYHDPQSSAVSIYHWHADASGRLNYEGTGNGVTNAYWSSVIDHGTYHGKPFTGDFNGDGKTDLMMIYHDPQSSAVSIYHWHADQNGKLSYAGTGNGGTHAYWSSVIDHGTYHGKPFTGDFNGDGKTDLMMIYHDPQSSAVSIYHWHADASGKLSYAGTGNGGTHAYWSSVIDHGTYHGKPFTGDFNGDGKTDLMMIYHDPNSSAVSIYHWNADHSGKLSYASTGNGGTHAYWSSVIDSPTYKGMAFADDFSGDGKTDLLMVYRDPNAGAISVYHWNAVGAYPDLATSITNGLGIKAEIDYQPLTNNSVYTKDTTTSVRGYPYQEVQTPMYVVSRTRGSNGIGGISTNTYQYGGKKHHHLAGESLGFRWIQVTDPAGLIHATYNNQDRENALDGTVARNEVYVPSGVRIKYSASTWTRANGVCGGTPQAVLTSSVEQNRELDGSVYSTVNTTNTHDSCGFPTTTVIDHGGGNIRTVVNQYIHDTATWRLGQLMRTDVTNEAPNQTPQTRTSTFSYNALGLIEQEVIEPGNTALAVTTTYGYDGFGNRTSKTISGSGITTRTESQVYGARGQFVVSKTNTLGHSSTFEYDDRSGAVTKVTDPNLLVATFDYDGFGRKGLEVRPDGTRSVIKYAATDTGYSLHVDTEGSGDMWTFYDRLGRVMRTSTQAFGGQWIYKDTSYNALGQVVRVSHADLSEVPPYGTTFEYDILGRNTKVIEAGPGNRTTTTSYSGLSTTVTNPLGQAKTTLKDSQGRVISVTDAAGTTNYNYDAFGNLTSVNALGSVVSMQYDIRGRKIAMQDPDMGNWTYLHNVLGELTSQTDAKLKTTTMAYDVAGRMVQRVTTEGTSTWQYDIAALGTTGRLAKGSIAKTTGPGGYVETYNYDDLARGTKVNTTISAATYITETAYGAFSRVDTITYPNTGFKVKQIYDDFGYLHQVNRLNGATETLVWKADVSDAQGRITDEVFGNGLLGKRIYNAETKDLEAIRTGFDINNPTVQKHSYSFDAIDNLLQRVDELQNLTENFTYDDLNRLTQATGAVTKDYAYAPNGNIISKSGVGTYTYGGTRPHAVTQIAGTVNATYTYDANGNQLTGGGRTMTYTSFNKPKTIKKGGLTTTLTYDPNYNRVVKATSTSTTVYVGRLYETVTTGTLVEHKHYIYGGKSLVSLYTDRNNGAKEFKYFHTNHLDSIDVVTGEQGQVLERLSFDPHGKRRNVNGTDATGITSTVNRGFTRHEHDDEVGLINMNARLYDPVIGRFITPDAIIPGAGNSQSYNRYSYVNNNPLALVDPTGHFSLRRHVRAIVRAFFAPSIKNVFDVLHTAPGAKIVERALIKYPILRMAAQAVAAYFGGPMGAAAFSMYMTMVAGGSASDAFKAGATSLFTSAVFIGVGEMGLTGAAQIGAHALAGGVTNAVRGGSFRDGAISGGLGALASPMVEGIGNPLGRVMAAGVVGGAAAKASGGNFEDGFTTAAFGRLFNHEWHNVGTWGARAGAAAGSAVGAAIGFGIGAAVYPRDATNDGQYYLNHYTNEAGYNGIMKDKFIAPGAESGLVHVTPGAYTSGEMAQAQLALKVTPIGYFSIPGQNIGPLHGGGPVAPKHGQPGGGIEFAVNHPVSIAGARWVPIGP